VESAPLTRPIADDLTRPWWDAAREGRLLIQRCDGCGHHQFYPRAHCVACGGVAVAWVEASGKGRLHTFTVVRKTPNAAFRDRCPYVLAIVRLDEGPCITTNVEGWSEETLRCDAPVQVVFRAAEDDVVLPRVVLA
jgi:uncharacterized OB-fold protein